MKKMLLACLMMLLALPSFVVSSTAKLLPQNAPADQTPATPEADHHRGLTNVDVRRDPGTLALNGAASLTGKRAGVDRTAAVDALIAQAPIADLNSLVVDLHASGVPKTVVNLDGVLTSPRSGSPDAIARDFFIEHSELFGLSGDEVANLRITMDNLDEESGTTYLKYEQMIGSLPVFDSEIGVTISASGEVVIVNQGQTLPGAVVSTDAAFTDEQAVAKAFAHCGVEISADALRVSADKRGEASEFVAYENPLGAGRPDVLAQKTVVNILGQAVLAYRTIVPTQSGVVYNTLVDAASGELLVRATMTHDVSGQVFKRDGASGRTLQPFTPLFGVTDPWVNPAYGTVSAGNNVFAMTDRDGSLGSDPVTTGATGPDAGLSNGFADSSKGSPVGQFSFAWSPTANPNTQGAQSATNLFYLCNYMHDWMYSLGFTESARNFQLDNYGRGGVAGDFVFADAQDVAYPNASNFTTFPDGTAGLLEVGIYTTAGGPKDASLDGDVVLHEYGHGVSNRLIGNGSGLAGTQSSALGEGWSDYWAISNYDDGLFGEYSTYNYGRGMRRSPYGVAGVYRSYADVGYPSFEAHNDGEIWADTLFDLYKTLGKAKADKLVLVGMKNTPTSPSFVSARTGIITACQTLYPASVRAAWEVFARHGLGYSANGNDGTTHNAATNLPPGYGGNTTCSATSMSAGIMSPQTLTGTLAGTDCMTTAGNLANSAFFDRYTYTPSEDQVVTVSMNSAAIDTYLRLKDATGAVLASNNNYNGNVNAKIIYTVESGKTYTFEALSWLPYVTGSYTVTFAISNVPGGRCQSGFGSSLSEPYAVERSGEHIVKTHYSGIFSLQKWDGANWQQVYSTSYTVLSPTGWSPFPRQAGVHNGGPGIYRWDVYSSTNNDFCYDWP